jgi:hypothetical protein
VIDRRPYLQRVGDALSQAINVVLLNGDPDESISGRSYRMTALTTPSRNRWWIARWIAEAVFFWERGQHTRLAYEQDLERARVRAAVLNKV